jgi:hypothetical protein
MNNSGKIGGNNMIAISFTQVCYQYSAQCFQYFEDFCGGCGFGGFGGFGW